jgi:DNA-directed RNA polymerase specialized sigma24 family protein
MQVEADEKDSPDDSDWFTVVEIYDSISRLSDGEVARLVSAAKAFSRLCAVPAEDLLQEAYARALEGVRNCRRQTNIVAFLCGVMKSLTSQEIEARKSGFRPVSVMRNGESILPDVAADSVSPEQSAASAINDRTALAKIDALVAGDEQLQLLIEGIDDQMRGAELQELLGLNEKGLAALRRKLSLDFSYKPLAFG